jgi:hypothetical protein
MEEGDFDISVDSSEDLQRPTTGLYANAAKAEDRGTQLFSQRGDSADEVDPRKLNRDPTLSEIRWYYRRTFASVLVNKPIEDAFKNDFEVVGDNADEAENLLTSPRFEDMGSYPEAYQMAEKKARRDGFALIFIGTKERGSSGVHVSPIDEEIDVSRISHLKVLTVDHLSGNGSNVHEQIKEGTGLDREQYDVRKTGIVVNLDIDSPHFREPVGYVLDTKDGGQFIHKDRVQHLTWHREVDGDYKGSSVKRYQDQSTLGMYEGDSVLIPSYNIMKGIEKGDWAITQALFRNAAHMYSVELPEDADEEDLANAVAETRNMSAKSALVMPYGYDLTQHASGNELQPQEYFDVLFDQICAGHEMTKSVLFGTQAGTVSGSEVDIKNYFNKVERYRTNRAEQKIEEYLTRAKKMLDSRTSSEYQYPVEIEWGPLFKVDEETRMQMLQTASQSVTTLIGQYALTPNEARELLTEEFTHVELDDLTEDQMDILDRVRLATSGQGQQALISEREYTSAPGTPEEGGREGGQEQGQTQSQTDPTSAQSDALDKIERLAALLEDGHITEDEFETLKEDILND